MAVLLIKCPHTGKAISKSFEIDPDSFAELPDVLSHVKCPNCGLEHAWWTREAWLEAGDQLGPALSNKAAA
jgi:hypothetical protein